MIPIDILVWTGVLTFAAMGAMAAIERRFDLLGVVVLASVTAVGGGSLRDVVVGQLPPAIFRDERLLWGVLGTALAVFVLRHRLKRLRRPIYWLDTLGLGLFAALGAERGLDAGLGFWGTIFAGAVSGVGGGVLRDVLTGEVPGILYRNRDLYATAATAGAATVFALHRLDPSHMTLAVAAGAIVAIVTRIAGPVLGLRLPRG
ncbi:MAG: TRIC cation channel family protein [Alphaproteobacteria bacterium]|nr:TRIC cation channel family protein [Alphaproteobacteria bacterium]